MPTDHPPINLIPAEVRAQIDAALGYARPADADLAARVMPHPLLANDAVLFRRMLALEAEVERLSADLANLGHWLCPNCDGQTVISADEPVCGACGNQSDWSEPDTITSLRQLVSTLIETKNRTFAERDDARAEVTRLRARLAEVDAAATAPECASVGYVLGGCGHWWHEHRPAGMKLDPGEPRVCSYCVAGDPGTVGVSPQGMGMVDVVYLHSPRDPYLPTERDRVLVPEVPGTCINKPEVTG